MEGDCGFLALVGMAIAIVLIIVMLVNFGPILPTAQEWQEFVVILKSTTGLVSLSVTLILLLGLVFLSKRKTRKSWVYISDLKMKIQSKTIREKKVFYTLFSYNGLDYELQTDYDFAVIPKYFIIKDIECGTIPYKFGLFFLMGLEFASFGQHEIDILKFHMGCNLYWAQLKLR